MEPNLSVQKPYIPFTLNWHWIQIWEMNQFTSCVCDPGPFLNCVGLPFELLVEAGDQEMVFLCIPALLAPKAGQLTL